MAKQYKEGKKSLKSNRKKPPVSIKLKESSSHSNNDHGVRGTRGSGHCGPGNTTSDCPNMVSSPVASCSCCSKLSNLLSVQMLDESTSDGLDITWEDQSRNLCVCQRGNPNSRVEELLSSLPSIDSPVSRQARLSLGCLTTDTANIKEMRTRRRAQKRDLESLKVLTNMLETVKSPVHEDVNNTGAKENGLKSPLEKIPRLGERLTVTHGNVFRTSEGHITGPCEDFRSLDKETVNKTNTDELLTHKADDHLHDIVVNEIVDFSQQDLCLDSDSILDQLFTDNDFLDQLSFSSLEGNDRDDAIRDNNKAKIEKQSEDDGGEPLHRPSAAVGTPFRMSVLVRKRVLHSQEKCDISVEQTPPISCHCSSSDDDDDEFFWTQVAGVMDSVPVVSAINARTCESVEEAIVCEVFDNDENELDSSAEKATHELHTDKSSQPRVYSQEDIERKRLIAKRKLQGKFKTI